MSNPWSKYMSASAPEARVARVYKDKPGVAVPVTPGHQPHVDAEGKPVEYEERKLGPRDVVELGKLSRQHLKPSPVRQALLERVMRSMPS